MPDYRFTLANERTFLAWLRTSLALIAGAVALAQFVPELDAVAAVLAALGVLVAAGGLHRWHRVQTSMERGETLPPNRMPLLLTVALAGLSALVAVLLLIPS